MGGREASRRRRSDTTLDNLRNVKNEHAGPPSERREERREMATSEDEAEAGADPLCWPTEHIKAKWS